MITAAIDLLSKLIATPSPSGEEHAAVAIIEQFLASNGIKPERTGNNVWACSAQFDDTKPTILLNSHLDTVRPCAGWTRDPFVPTLEDGKLYGLGSNDAGASVVALAFVFTERWAQSLPFNLVYAATAEEEISGSGGIVSILQRLPRVDAAIVGEPTSLQMAIAERGLMVLRCVAEGVAGHAAHGSGINAIDIALDDIAWLHSQPFERVSDLLGTVRATVTVIEAGSQHNVIPDRCTFTVDLRTTDAYTHEELLQYLQMNLGSRIERVSMRLRPSRIPAGHAFVRTAERLGIRCYGSPTLSDQALLPMPSVKMGPGDSKRSHTADEFVTIDELEAGLALYRRFLDALAQHVSHHPLEER